MGSHEKERKQTCMWIEILLTIGSAWSFLAVKALITNSQQLCPLCRVPIKVTQLARRALIYFHVVKFMSGVSHWVPIGYFPTRSLPRKLDWLILRERGRHEFGTACETWRIEEMKSKIQGSETKSIDFIFLSQYIMRSCTEVHQSANFSWKLRRHIWIVRLPDFVW